MNETVKEELSKIMHPEINLSLVKLGMIKDIRIESNIVSVTLMLPFLNIPIKEDLINLIKESVKNINIKIAEMNEKEKEKFMQLAREEWKF